MFDTIKILCDERASEVFLNVLGQLLASGEAVFARDKQNPTEPSPGATVIGYVDTEYIHLLPDVAYRLVTKYYDLKFTTSAIGTQLREDGLLMTSTNNRLTIQVRIRGTQTRLWRLKATVFETLDQ